MWRPKMSTNRPRNSNTYTIWPTRSTSTWDIREPIRTGKQFHGLNRNHPGNAPQTVIRQPCYTGSYPRLGPSQRWAVSIDQPFRCAYEAT